MGKAEKEQGKKRQKLEALAPEKIKEEQALKVRMMGHVACLAAYMCMYECLECVYACVRACFHVYLPHIGF